MGIIALLAALAFPSINGALEKANAAKSMCNMKQVTSGVLAYTGDNNGGLPPLYGTSGWNMPYWTTAVHPYVYGTNFTPKNNIYAGAVFYSPSIKRHHPIGDWGINSNIISLNKANQRTPLVKIERPATTALLFETKNTQNTSDASWYMNVPLAKANPQGWLADWHNGNPQVAFCDGSVRSFRMQELLATWSDMAGPDLDTP